MKTLEGHNFAEYFKYYVSLVTEENIEKSLKDSYGLIKSTIENLDEEKGNYAYAKDKWSIKELLVHIIDTERIFCERALRFARNDKTELPGFDHDEYVKFSNATFFPRTPPTLFSRRIMYEYHPSYHPDCRRSKSPSLSASCHSR